VAPLVAAKQRPWALLLGATLIAALAVAWFLTPLGELFDLDSLERLFVPLVHSAWAPAIVGGVFVVGGLLLVPVTLLIVATTAAFGPWLGGLYAIFGALLSGARGLRARGGARPAPRAPAVRQPPE